MTEFTTFFILLLAALLFPMLLRGFHVPWVVALVLAGIALGPAGLAVIGDGPVIEFFGQIGVVFLMFMAGLETGISRLKDSERESSVIAVVNGLVPFVTGFVLTFVFGYGVTEAIVIGIVFISSSVAVVLPTLERNQLIESRVGTTVIGSTMLQDITSLLLLGAVVHYATPQSRLPLSVFVILLMVSLLLFRWLLPKLDLITQFEQRKGFETNLRVVMVALIGVVVFYGFIGLHEIVAGFLAGLFLSDMIEGEMMHKIHGIGYGLFIPIFFIRSGAMADIELLVTNPGAIGMGVAIVVGTMVAKYVSGYIASRTLAFSRAESSIVGSTSIPQLSTALAVAYLGQETGLLDTQLVTVVIMLSVVTTIVGPTLINQTLKRMDTAAIEAQTTLSSWIRHE